MKPYKLVVKSNPLHNTIINVSARDGGVRLGSESFNIIVNLNELPGGDGFQDSLDILKQAGIKIVGLNMSEACLDDYPEDVERQALKLDHIRRKGMIALTGIQDYCQLEEIYPHVDMLHVASRHMQNYSLLEALGDTDKPVILERSFAATVEEWLMAAEYLINGGNQKVILCESGIRTFEILTRRTLDVSSIALVKSMSHLPVIAYPGQAAGRDELVLPLAKAAIASGADGICVDAALIRPEGSGERASNLEAVQNGGTEKMELGYLLESLRAAAAFEKRCLD